MNEGLLFGLVVAGILWLVMARAGVRPGPWREVLAFEVLGLVLWLVLRTSGVIDPSTSVFVGFVAAAIVVALWSRFARRPI